MTEFYVARDLPSLATVEDQIKGYPELDAAAIYTMGELLQTAHIVEKQLAKGLEKANLSRGRHVALWCIFYLGADDGITPAEIADQLGVTRATITGLLDGLERDSFIVREKHHKDRRKIIVRITEPGREKITEVWPVHYKRITNAMAILTDRDRTQLVKILKKVQSQAALLSV